MKVAIITMCYNEGAMLDLWARHYGNLVGMQNLFILDHGSSDGSTVSCGGNVIRLPRGEFDDNRRATAISLQQQALLRFYDAVVYTDTDEFLVVDPARHGSFMAFMQTVNGPVTAPLGIDVAHLPKTELAIDFRRPILSQRRFGLFKASGSKPVIVTEPTEWAGGFHMVRSEPDFRSDIMLFHLKAVDLERGLERLRVTRALEWPEASLKIGIGGHQRIDDETYVQWFHGGRQAALDNGDMDEFSPEQWIELMKRSYQDYKGFVRFEQDLISGKEIKSRLFRIPERFYSLL